MRSTGHDAFRTKHLYYSRNGLREDGERAGLNEEAANAYALVNPPGMSVDRLLRYWKKTREAAGSG